MGSCFGVRKGFSLSCSGVIRGWLCPCEELGLSLASWEEEMCFLVPGIEVRFRISIIEFKHFSIHIFINKTSSRLPACVHSPESVDNLLEPRLDLLLDDFVHLVLLLHVLDQTRKTHSSHLLLQVGWGCKVILDISFGLGLGLELLGSPEVFGHIFDLSLDSSDMF